MKQEDHILKHKFENLFREHFNGLCYFAKKYLGDMDSSKEVVHSVFLKIWENRLEFDWLKPAKSYLFTAVYNKSMNFLRDNKKFISDDNDDVGNVRPDSVEFTDTMELAELENSIENAINLLPEKCREVFRLNRFEGKKYAEIATHLKISVKTVETQMSKALKILKEELKEYLYILLLGLFIKSMSTINPPERNSMLNSSVNTYTNDRNYSYKECIIAHQGKANSMCDTYVI